MWYKLKFQMSKDRLGEVVSSSRFVALDPNLQMQRDIKKIMNQG